MANMEKLQQQYSKNNDYEGYGYDDAGNPYESADDYYADGKFVGDRKVSRGPAVEKIDNIEFQNRGEKAAKASLTSEKETASEAAQPIAQSSEKQA